MQENKCEKSWLNMDPELQDFEAEKGFWSKVGQSFLMWLVAFALVIMTVMIVGCGDGGGASFSPAVGGDPCAHLTPDVQAGATDRDYQAYAGCRQATQ
jgi:hypothetical protein